MDMTLAWHHPVRNESRAWAGNDASVEVDCRAGDVDDERSRLRVAELHAAVAGDARDRGREGIGRLRAEDGDVADVAVPQTPAVSRRDTAPRAVRSA
jgi:hypothetical protein